MFLNGGIPDELLLQSVTALLNRAIENREKLKPEERNCECLSIEVLRLNNEIDRQMTNPRANADQLLQLIAQSHIVSKGEC